MHERRTANRTTAAIAAPSRRTVQRRFGGLGLTAALGLAAPRPTAAQDDEDGEALTRQDINLAQARAVIDAAVAEAERLHTLMDIAVLDAGANLKAFARMDGAWLGGIDVALKKARTAALFETPSGDLGPLVQPGEPIYGAEVSSYGLITFAGGLPLLGSDGTIIGAIGVSGSSVGNDLAVAAAGVAALGGGGDAATPRP